MPAKWLFRFMSAISEIEMIYDNYAENAGLNYVSMSILEMLYCNKESLTQKAICERMHQSKQIINPVIKSFCDSGYVYLKVCENDRRSKVVLLTEKGREYAKEILGPMIEIEKQALSLMTEDEKVMLVNIISKCRDNYVKAEQQLKHIGQYPTFNERKEDKIYNEKNC